MSSEIDATVPAPPEAPPEVPPELSLESPLVVPLEASTEAPAEMLPGLFPEVPPTAPEDPSSQPASTLADAAPSASDQPIGTSVTPATPATPATPDTLEDHDASEAELRASLHQQFDHWLDRMLGDEAPPEGLPPEVLELGDRQEADASGGDTGLYQLFSALTVLTGEVRLQGRAFKQLTDALAPLGATPQRLAALESAQLDAVDDLQELAALARRREEADAGPLPAPREALDVLLDLRERLDRGRRDFEAALAKLTSLPSGPWWRRLLHPSAGDPTTALTAMRDGYALTLSRVDAALQQWHVRVIDARGQAFDPRSMTAIDVAETSTHPDGTVLEVYRNGYTLNGQLLIAAQVKVARAAAPPEP